MESQYNILRTGYRKIVFENTEKECLKTQMESQLFYPMWLEEMGWGKESRKFLI